MRDLAGKHQAVGGDAGADIVCDRRGCRADDAQLHILKGPPLLPDQGGKQVEEAVGKAVLVARSEIGEEKMTGPLSLPRDILGIVAVPDDGDRDRAVSS